MPPKRKRDDAQTIAGEPPSGRTTRASGRTSATAVANIESGTTVGAASASTAKKPRVTKVGSGSARTKVGSSRIKTSPLTHDDTGVTTTTIRTSKRVPDDPDLEGPPNVTVTSNFTEKYNPDNIISLFTHFASASSPTPDNEIPDYIGPEGFELLCNEANLPLSGALPLILAWQLGAGEMGKIKKDEWVNGLSKLKVSSIPVLSLALYDLEDMLLLDKTPLALPSSANTAGAGPPPVKGRKRGTGTTNNVNSGGSGNSRSSKGSAAGEPYDRTLYFSYVSDKKKAFGELYQFCFTLAKPPQGRNIDIETAIAFWSVLLTPQYPIIAEVIEFLNEKGTYKGANKDLWSMMLEFCRTVDLNLEGYEMDGAWPTLLDDFVSWKKNRRAEIRESGIVIEEPE